MPDFIDYVTFDNLAAGDIIRTNDRLFDLCIVMRHVRMEHEENFIIVDSIDAYQSVWQDQVLHVNDPEDIKEFAIRLLKADHG